MRTRLTALVAAAALAGLTACGTELAPEIHPGAAAVVDGSTISLEEVDELALELCSVDRPAREASGQPAALGFYRGLAVQNLTDYELARQYADAHGLEPGPEFARRLQQAEQQFREQGAPQGAADVLVAFQERAGYRDAILEATGDPRAAEADFNAWVEGVDVAVDPRFGSVDMASGGYSPPEGLSVRVTEPAPQDAVGLPADQRCG